ncbi:MAG TPA: hypothetical protein PLD88_11095, partial [Candidatus Berkiella sp.]|nr:hypothetical protein [Candidatus Berkiella sp.]
MHDFPILKMKGVLYHVLPAIADNKAMTTPEPTEPAPPSTDGLGRFMVIISWVIILALLTFFFNQWYKKYQMNTHATIITSEGVKQTVLQRNYLNH